MRLVGDARDGRVQDQFSAARHRLRHRRTRRVDLRSRCASTSPPDRGSASSTLALAVVGAGQLHGSGGNLSLDGIWKVAATVSGPGGAVEVALVFATRAPGPARRDGRGRGAPDHLDGPPRRRRHASSSTSTRAAPGRTSSTRPSSIRAGTELPVASATFLVDAIGWSRHGRRRSPARARPLRRHPCRRRLAARRSTSSGPSPGRRLNSTLHLTMHGTTMTPRPIRAQPAGARRPARDRPGASRAAAVAPWRARRRARRPRARRPRPSSPASRQDRRADVRGDGHRDERPRRARAHRARRSSSATTTAIRPDKATSTCTSTTTWSR